MKAKASRVGRPTKHEAAALDIRILDVAAALFASQGFAATSMEQVASACGAGKDTVYRRYASKAALFAALMERLHARLSPELDRVTRSKADSLDRLRQYARTLLAINLRPEFLALNRVALGEAMPFGGVRPIPVGEDPIMKRFAALVETAQRDGRMADGDPAFIAEQLLYASAIKPMIAAMLGDSRYAEPRAQDDYFARAWVQFLAGAASRAVLPRSEPSEPAA